METIERRRAQSLGVVLTVMAGLAASATLLTFGSPGDYEDVFYLRLTAFRAAPPILIFCLAMYLVQQHRELRTFTRRAFEDKLVLEEMTEQLEHDSLTGLLSRDRFVDKVEVALAAGRPTAVLFVDLDNFKTVNDTWGHNSGDHLLVEVAARLTRSAGADNVGRYSGDEFVILVDCTDGGESAAAISAAHALKVLAEPVWFGPDEFRPTAAVGIAISGLRTASASELIREADVAMYMAKERGKAQWALFEHGDHSNQSSST